MTLSSAISETIPASGAVELAVVERSGFIESRHLGAAVVMAPDGTVKRSLGDIHTPIFPRSTLKMVQAAVSVALGAELQGPELAIATASHTGTAAHRNLVAGILSDGELEVDHLGCPPALPSHQESLAEAIRAGDQPSRIWMNCSGKHAAMLRACQAQGWDESNYLDPSHPLQQEIAHLVATVAQEPIAWTGVDGCGAPLFALSLLGLARATSWVKNAQGDSSDRYERAAARIVEQVMAHPWAIHGPGAANTVVIEKLGVFAKGGAEGVIVMAAPDGTVVALKMLDGSERATTIVALELLIQAGSLASADVDLVAEELKLTIFGGENAVGRIRVSIPAQS